MPGIPDRLPAGVTSYARSPDFTPETLPAKLQSAHALKTGTWGLLHVIAGKLRYSLEPPEEGEVIASAGQSVVIAQNSPHRVAFVEPGLCYIEFFRSDRGGSAQASGAP